MYYKIDEHHNVLPSSIKEWETFKQDSFPKNWLKVDHSIIEDKEVSTCFFGISYLDNDKLFETVVFDKDGKTIDQYRYYSYQEAKEGHKKMCDLFHIDQMTKALDKFYDKYILDENNNVISATIWEWSKFFSERERRIVKKDIVNGKLVSTVFIGIAHNFYCPEDGSHKPHIFETMVFENETAEGDDIYYERYSTWKEAKEGHEQVAQWVKDGMKEI